MSEDIKQKIKKRIEMLRNLETTVEDENNEDKQDFDVPCSWSNLKNDEYAPAYITTPKVPAGVYEIGWNSNMGTYTLRKQPFKTDELYHLPSPEITDILKDIENF